MKMAYLGMLIGISLSGYAMELESPPSYDRAMASPPPSEERQRKSSNVSIVELPLENQTETPEFTRKLLLRLSSQKKIVYKVTIPRRELKKTVTPESPLPTSINQNYQTTPTLSKSASLSKSRTALSSEDIPVKNTQANSQKRIIEVDRLMTYLNFDKKASDVQSIREGLMGMSIEEYNDYITSGMPQEDLERLTSSEYELDIDIQPIKEDAPSEESVAQKKLSIFKRYRAPILMAGGTVMFCLIVIGVVTYLALRTTMAHKNVEKYDHHGMNIIT